MHRKKNKKMENDKIWNLKKIVKFPGLGIWKKKIDHNSNGKKSGCWLLLYENLFQISRSFQISLEKPLCVANAFWCV